MRALGVAFAHREPPLELSADARFAGRIRRLAATSVFGLGAIALLSAATLDAPRAVDAALVGGWVLMPVLLAFSLRRPLVRYALVVPSTLVGVGLVVLCLVALPHGDPVAVAGWLLVTAGVLVGGWLGLWFWFRIVPVPAVLDDPFSRGRWALIGLHVALILVGLTAIVLSL
jgi:hypothetical protein